MPTLASTDYSLSDPVQTFKLIPPHPNTYTRRSSDITRYSFQAVHNTTIPHTDELTQKIENWSPLIQVQLQVNYSLPGTMHKDYLNDATTAHFPVHSIAKGSYYCRNQSSITGALPCQLSQNLWICTLYSTVKISNTGLNCFNGLIVYTPLSQTALRRVLIMSWIRRGWGKRLSSCQSLGLKFINRFRSQQFLPRPVVPSEGLGGGYLNAVT